MESKTYRGPLGNLDARLHGPTFGNPVVICPPHPRFGGTMGSRLVYDLAVALADAGYQAIRFDYSGVGRSAGVYGHGLGEAEDTRAILDAVEAECGKRPALVGYSFGGAVACRVAAVRDVARLVTIGTPTRITESAMHPLLDAPKVRARTVCIVGDQDGFVPIPDAKRLASAFNPAARLVVLEGAAHFLEPSHNPRAVAAALEALST